SLPYAPLARPDRHRLSLDLLSTSRSLARSCRFPRRRPPRPLVRTRLLRLRRPQRSRRHPPAPHRFVSRFPRRPRLIAPSPPNRRRPPRTRPRTPHPARPGPRRRRPRRVPHSPEAALPAPRRRIRRLLPRLRTPRLDHLGRALAVHLEISLDQHR